MIGPDTELRELGRVLRRSQGRAAPGPERRRLAWSGGAWTEFAMGIPQFYVQDARAWFTREGTRLLRIPKAGGATEILAVAARPIGTLAVDDKAVYNVGGALLRLDLE